MMEFLAMGGHGFYIWMSYAIAALSLGGLTIWSLQQAKAKRKELELTEKMKKG